MIMNLIWKKKWPKFITHMNSESRTECVAHQLVHSNPIDESCPKGCELNMLWLSSTEASTSSFLSSYVWGNNECKISIGEINFYAFYIHLVRWVVWGVLLNNKTLSCFHQQIQYWLKPLIQLFKEEEVFWQRLYI